MEDLHQIILGCTRNDRASQERLYKEYFVPLFGLCRRFFQNEHEAMESVNDGMMKVFERIGSYREDKGKFFTWVYTIVRNTALDKLRSSLAAPTLPGMYDVEESIPEVHSGYNPLLALEKKDFYRLMDELSPATRAVFNLFYIDGYAIREISEQLGLTTGTVKWQLSDGRRRLRIVFEKFYNH